MLGNIKRKLNSINTKVFYNKACDFGKFEDLIYYKGVGYSLPKIRSMKDGIEGVFKHFYKTSNAMDLKAVAFKMIECSRGSFMMGCLGNINAPLSFKAIDNSFLLGETEVTQELYEAVMGTNPSKYQESNKALKGCSLYPFSLKHPVECVSWFDVINFCNRLSVLQGLDKCYSVKKYKIGILRDIEPGNKKDLMKYNAFYASLEQEIMRAPKPLESNSLFKVEYDPDISTCDALIIHSHRSSKYLVQKEKIKPEAEWERFIDLSTYEVEKPYHLYQEMKNDLKEFLEIQRPTVLCDFRKNGYRLPTEMEWEYAAKASTKNRWSGTNILHDLSKYSHNRPGSISTHPVKTKKPNEWGFYDMSGNVEEWCWAEKKAGGFFEASDSELPHRGGGFGSASDKVTVFRVSSSDVLHISSDLGFRICRSIVN